MIRADIALFLLTAVWVPNMVIMVMHGVLNILISNMDHRPMFSGI